MRRTLSILIENKPGALARVVGLFHQRGYNIESLNVAPIFDGSYSRMTVSTRGTENVVEQITNVPRNAPPANSANIRRPISPYRALT